MRIVLLEDNPIQVEPMREEFFRCRLCSQKEDLLYIRTESEFMARLEEIKRFQPHVVVVDVMVMWATPSPNTPERPAKVKEEGYFLAGVRCAEALHQMMAGVPLIFYTIVDPVDLEPYLRENAALVIVPKGPYLSELVEKIRAVVQATGERQ